MTTLRRTFESIEDIVVNLSQTDHLHVLCTGPGEVGRILTYLPKRYRRRVTFLFKASKID